MKLQTIAFVWAFAAILFGMQSARAVDFSRGVAATVPVRDGTAPVIDGQLEDWDLSAREPVYINDQTVKTMHAEWAFMYDDEALYVGVRATLPGRPLVNRNRPQDAFWFGDLLQIRLAADPRITYPLHKERDQKNDRVTHISLWKNTEDGTDHLHIGRGTKLDLGQEADPQGAQIVIKSDGVSEYVAEAKIPWAALRVPGGKNPFEPGQRMPLVAETLWVGGDHSRVAAIYRANPGTFAFNSPDKWGQLEFAPRGFSEARRPAMQQIIRDTEKRMASADEVLGVPISVRVPAEGMMTSVNIMGPKGEVIRELTAGIRHPQGELKVYWDGHDAWGHPMSPGQYRWSALFHRGLKAEYVGGVGNAGVPPYPTADDHGSWGGDHSNPLDCAADATGLYFLWPVAEAGRPIVKTDDDGKVLWRKNPFVGGGFGPFYAIAADGRHVYLTLGLKDVRLVQLTAKDGVLQSWGDGGPSELPVHQVTPARIPAKACPTATKHDVHAKHATISEEVEQPDAIGLAVYGDELFLSSYSQNKILVLNKATGKRVRDLECAGPRGLAIDAAGHLLAASYVPGKVSRIVRFTGRAGEAQPIVSTSLEAPYDVAADKQGTLYVSDLGKAQQIKVFKADGSAAGTFGKAGGRPWQGRYDGLAFLNPAGVAIDAQGNLLVTESSLPRICSRLSTKDGRAIRRWFGPGVYWNSTWPMPNDPKQVFYSLGEGLARGTLGAHADGRPDAYWAPDLAGYPHAGNIGIAMPHPEVIQAQNSQIYLVMDVTPHTIFVMQDDLLRPVARWERVGGDIKRFPENKTGKPYVNVWMDANGDGQIQPAEQAKLTRLADGSPVPDIHDLTGSLHMEPNGDLYFVTKANSILKVPARGFSADGMIRWDLSAATLAVPKVLPSLNSMEVAWRHGILGVRLDRQGNLYTVFNTRVPGKGGAFDYPSEAVAKKLFEGLGHTSTFNVVKFAKYDPSGNVLWMAGRKATQGAKPGEMYHFWNLAGMVGDQYVAGGSEWGQIYFYTHDGFYVDAVMNNPALMPVPGPYTFGGETSGGRVAYFPDRDEVWAYSSGLAFQIHGFKNGRLEGEQRASGEIQLDQVYAARTEAADRNPLELARVNADPLSDANVWAGVPERVIKQNDQTLAAVQLGYDEKFIFGRIQVTDSTPLQNSAESVALAFKGGDTAGIVLGPPNERKTPGFGDVRIMVAQIGGQPRLIGMKAVTRQNKHPFEYATPASGTIKFEFVGEIPGGQVTLMRHADGYVASFAVPRSFLEFELKPGVELRGDVEIRLSGAGARGLQAVSRRYLFTPARPETTLVDDVPTESRLYPEYWGGVRIK